MTHFIGLALVGDTVAQLSFFFITLFRRALTSTTKMMIDNNEDREKASCYYFCYLFLFYHFVCPSVQTSSHKLHPKKGRFMVLRSAKSQNLLD